MDAGKKILPGESKNADSGRLTECGAAGEPGGKQWLSRAEVEGRLTSLSADDIRRLANYARFLRDPNDANDLIQEAYSRVLDRRRWRADMTSVAFLCGVMRSISDRRNQKDITVVSFEDAEEAAEGVDDHLLVDRITPERNAIAAEEIKELEAHFAHDEHVGYFLMGAAEGKTALETQAATGMSPQQYDAARKRVLRYRKRQLKDG